MVGFTCRLEHMKNKVELEEALNAALTPPPQKDIQSGYEEEIMMLPHDIDDKDGTEALMTELERIKEERVEEKLQQQEQLQELKPKEHQLILRVNPVLLNTSNNFDVKRRWDGDVVFKNLQDRGETKVSKRFVNDTIRNEFQQKFLQKYMK